MSRAFQHSKTFYILPFEAPTLARKAHSNDPSIRLDELSVDNLIALIKEWIKDVCNAANHSTLFEELERRLSTSSSATETYKAHLLRILVLTENTSKRVGATPEIKDRSVDFVIGEVNLMLEQIIKSYNEQVFLLNSAKSREKPLEKERDDLRTRVTALEETNRKLVSGEAQLTNEIYDLKKRLKKLDKKSNVNISYTKGGMSVKKVSRG